MRRIFFLMPRGIVIKFTILWLTVLYLLTMTLFYYNTHLVYNVNGVNVDNDREVLLGKFLLEEKSLNFSFETFQSQVAVSLSKDEFRVKLDPEMFELKDVPLEKYFFTLNDQTYCFIDGTDMSLSKAKKRCSCKMLNTTTPLYFGEDCGIPLAIWQSSSKDLSKWQRRKEPRRLIYALPLNHEFDIFETRMSMHYDVVDVFIVGESNRTNSGGVKEPYFLLRFSAGWLKEWQQKLLYVFQGDFPDEGYEDGVIADNYMRRHLTRSGFRRLTGVKVDDLFVYTDGDELILPEILTFLKLYDGYSEPVAFKYKWAIYGFYWQVQESHFGQHKWPEPGAMSVRFFRDFYRLDSSHVRTHDFEKYPKMLHKYQSLNRSVGVWDIFDAGWHCSWCFSPEGIRKKLLDAPKSDYPRYGDDVAKTQVDYIKRLIKHGLYFNLGVFREGGREITPEDDPEMAPKYILDHEDRMGYLLRNPYKNATFDRIKFHNLTYN